METVLEILNSNAVVAAIVSAVIYLLNKLYVKKPTWQKYEGTIISAVRAAEKMIPNDAENKSLARLDAALKYVVKTFEDVEKRRISDKEIAEIKEGISIVHNRIEA